MPDEVVELVVVVVAAPVLVDAVVVVVGVVVGGDAVVTGAVVVLAAVGTCAAVCVEDEVPQPAATSAVRTSRANRDCLRRTGRGP